MKTTHEPSKNLKIVWEDTVSDLLACLILGSGWIFREKIRDWSLKLLRNDNWLCHNAYHHVYNEDQG